MNYERITDDKEYDGLPRERHELRYKIANLFIKPEDTVVDCACGTGYAKKLLGCKVYCGVDKEDLPGVDIRADLNTWEPELEFDVFISIETIEHLEDWQHLLKVGRQAKRLMVVSTPIIPTKHENEFHVQDFTFEQVSEELEQDGWKIHQFLIQDNQYGIWILTK